MSKVIQLGNYLEKDEGGRFRNPQCGRIYSINGCSPTINTCQGGDRQPKVLIKRKYGDKNTMENDSEYQIRKLTPKEFWRLQGFSDEDFDKASGTGMSDSQLYKQAGNSICVDVLYYIFKELYTSMPYLFDDLKVSSFFSGIGAFEKGLDKLYENIRKSAI